LSRSTFHFFLSTASSVLFHYRRNSERRWIRHSLHLSPCPVKNPRPGATWSSCGSLIARVSSK